MPMDYDLLLAVLQPGNNAFTLGSPLSHDRRAVGLREQLKGRD